ncbi:hypothetical protein MJO29_008372 [Puccinia striiformis f. sp. tritici]|nr:hypothetical protein MJO29_008372 [Puccinia striiformis f. sp. tritici]
MPPPPKVTKPRACINKKTGKKPLDGELENLTVSLKGKRNVGTSKTTALASKQAKEKRAANTHKKSAEASKKAATLAEKTALVPTRQSSRTAENKRKNDNEEHDKTKWAKLNHST